MNQWKSIWNSRNNSLDMLNESEEDIFLSLKNLMGVSPREKLNYSDFQKQFDSNLRKMKGLLFQEEPHSYFEVGCGSGMYLFYLGRQNKAQTIGGVDYSSPLLEAAAKALCPPYISAEIKELYCDEAANIKTDISYDCVYARSVFQYFPSEEYGRTVAEKMLLKAKRCVGIFDVFDTTKKDDFLSYRRSVIDHYDEKYADTPHQFYSKEMFLQLAEQYKCDVFFSRDALPGYWNESFVYDVYLYPRR